MGKRSTSTTKSGKFMNPTDQARKEARRRELKKNKKQRLLVRQAVLKGKDIANIFTELEKIDQMEFNPVQTAPLSEKVLKEKRKKLRDTLNRVMRLYEKEDPTQWTQIKALEVQYEKRRAELIIYCESVKHTHSVNLEEIPLPNLNADSTSGTDASLPPPPQHGILKKISAFGDAVGASLTGRLYRRAPGVPSVPPPELHDIWDEGDGDGSGIVSEPGVPGIDDQDEDMDGLPPYHTYYQFIRPENVPLPESEEAEENQEDNMAEEDEESSEEEMEDEPGTPEKPDESAATGPAPAKVEPISVPKPTSLQQRMLAIAGQDVDTFMKEMEVAHRQRVINRQTNLENRLARLERGESADDLAENPQPAPPGPAGPAGPPQMQPFPPGMGFQRPPLGYPPMSGPPPPGIYGGGYGQLGARLPPGPPPRLPAGLPPRMAMRPPGMPPPPPPGLRPGIRPPTGPVPSIGSGPVAAKPSASGGGSKAATVIEAKPQMRNLSADLTRFVPTTLKLKKETPQPVKKIPEASTVRPSAAPRIEWRIPQPPQASRPAGTSTGMGMANAGKTQTKDDAYSQFMKEMNQLIN